VRIPTGRDRYRGALLGLAVGDALGTTLEFAPRGVHPSVTDMVGGGPFALAPGAWTDDTSMALCLAASLIESSDFDPVDQMSRYVRWWRDGYMSVTGSCFDIGETTAAALARFEREGIAFAGSTDPQSAQRFADATGSCRSAVRQHARRGSGARGRQFPNNTWRPGGRRFLSLFCVPASRRAFGR
jgi:ADP-ribosylglycohydrolase